jgi:NAD(P)-dependent dehydrogenase (short-subunit alcohol dehydrogenase family)
MSRIFITGSSEGLGLMAGQLLASQGHSVVLHARNPDRAEAASRALPQAEAIINGDVSTISGARDVAALANMVGPFDAVIHNVGVGYREKNRIETADGLPHVFAINVIAPYVLTALMGKPTRLVYLSSGMHRFTGPHLDDIKWLTREWDGAQAYSESKLYNVLFAFAISRLWPDVRVNALEPGWVPTRMGGPEAPDDLRQAHLTQAWLASSDAAEACVTGEYFYHKRRRAPNPVAYHTATQDRLLTLCGEITGIPINETSDRELA